VEKIVINMVDSNRGMRDTVVWVSDQWDVDSEDEREDVLVVLNLDTGTHRGTLSTIDVKVKLRKSRRL